MRLFNKTSKKEETNQPVNQTEQLEDFSKLNHIFNQDQKIVEKQIKSIFNYDQFQIDTREDGGYFGSEFLITTTVGRLKQLYLREPWVYTTADLIARTLTTIKFQVVNANNGEVLENHPLNDIVNRGNHLQDQMSRDKSIYLDLILTGNAPLVTDENYKVGVHVPIESANFKIREGNTEEQKKIIFEQGPYESLELINYFAYVVDPQEIPFEQVVYFKLANPFTPLVGLSPYAAASRPILLDRVKNEFEMAFYLRGATKSGVIETDQEISRPRLSRLMSLFEQAFTGKRNWWRTIFLPKGAKWKESSLTMQEMDHLEGLRENRRTLLAVLGIPPSQVGIVEDVNRSTAEIQEKSFWQNTIIPLTNFIAAGWNGSYLVRNVYKDEVRVEPDLEGIEALEGSLATKAELTKELENILLINELREIVGYEPLEDERGELFVSEVKSKSQVSVINPSSDSEARGNLAMGNTDDGDGEYRHFHTAQWDQELGVGSTLSTEGNGPKHDHEIKSFKVLAGGEDNHKHPDLLPELEDSFKKLKAQLTKSQEQIEETQGEKYLKALEIYIDLLLDQAKRALRQGTNVESALLMAQNARKLLYEAKAVPVLIETMNKGFDQSLDSTKKVTKYKVKQSIFTEKDEQAVEAIKQRDEDGQRKTLTDRAITSFLGIDATKTEQVMTIITEGLEQGLTTEEVAKTLEQKYGERYKDQAFTITRTETLSAVSEGIKWNHQTLKQVFSEVNKQWIHVGDVATNPDAREVHAEWENSGFRGVVPSDFVYFNPETGGKLQYPRDPMGGAADVINCRCSMANVIPKNATSRADQIITD